MQLLSTMNSYQALKNTLDAIASEGPELLRHLSNGTIHGTGDQAVSLLEDTSKSMIQQPRKKLMESATRLLQLITIPDDYLAHLANSVGFPTSSSHW